MSDAEGGLVIALFDVLGFEDRVGRFSLEEIHEQYEELLSVVKSKGQGGGFFDIRPAGDGMMVPFFGYLDINYHYFSDTIILWTPFRQPTLMPFIHACCSLFCDLLLAELPVRGAVALGKAIMDKDEGRYYGQPLVEAARVEKAQHWLGLGLGPSFADRQDVPMRVDLIRPYEDHLKPEIGDSIPGLAIDWPRIWRTDHEISVLPLLERLSSQGNAREYYQRTIKFVKLSDEDPNWWNRYSIGECPDGVV